MNSEGPLPGSRKALRFFSGAPITTLTCKTLHERNQEPPTFRGTLDAFTPAHRSLDQPKLHSISSKSCGALLQPSFDGDLFPTSEETSLEIQMRMGTSEMASSLESEPNFNFHPAGVLACKDCTPLGKPRPQKLEV